MLARTGARNAVSYLSLETIADADAYALARTRVEVVANSQYRIPHHKTTDKRPKPTLIALRDGRRHRGDRSAIERGVDARRRRRRRHVA